jgi:hypothetical protein
VPLSGQQLYDAAFPSKLLVIGFFKPNPIIYLIPHGVGVISQLSKRIPGRKVRDTKTVMDRQRIPMDIQTSEHAENCNPSTSHLARPLSQAPDNKLERDQS